MPFLNANMLSRFSGMRRDNQITNLRFRTPEPVIEEVQTKEEPEEESFRDFIKKCPSTKKMRDFMRKRANKINEDDDELF